jgi:hypothetical protein
MLSGSMASQPLSLASLMRAFMTAHTESPLMLSHRSPGQHESCDPRSAAANCA